MKALLWAGTALIGLMGASAAQAQYVVTEITDNGTGGTAGSLSNAILQANATGGTISFNLNGGATSITQSGNMLAIAAAAPMTINGGGITLNANGNQAFDITSGTVDFQNLTLTGGDMQGNFTISAGSLRLGNGGTTGGLGAGAVTNNSDLTFNRNNSLTIANAISGTGTLTQAGTGTTILTAANSYAGITTITSGVLQVGAGGTVGTLGTGNVTNNASLVFNRSNASAYGGVISGSGSVTKSAAGTLTLTGVQTYTGATIINGGTLALSGSGTIADSSGVDLTSAILNISATTTGISVKKVTGASGNIVLGSKTLTITGAGTNYGGVFSGAGGNLIFNGNAILSGTNSADGNATIASGVTVTLGAGGSLGTISNTAMNNSGTLAVNHAAGASINIFTNISGTGGITLLAANAETVALTGTNSYSGLTDIQGGSLTLNNLGGISANTTFNVGANGLLRLTSISPTLANVTGSGTVLINKIGPGAPQTLSLNGANFTGTINEASAGQQLVAASGTSILAGNNNWTGSTTINAGATLQLGNGGTTGTIPTGAIVNNGTLAFSRSDNVTFAGNYTGIGGISQRGTGTLTFTGTNTSTGANSVNAGTLVINGSTGGVVNAGNGGTLKGTGTIGGFSGASGSTIAPGNSIGTLNVAGNVTFAAGSIYQVEVDAAGASDRIAATGTATINGGTVDVQAAAGTYGTATTYTILTATGGVTGTFTSATSNFIFLTPTLNYSANQVTLTLSQPAVVVPPVVVPPVVVPPAPPTFPAVALTPNQIASSTALQAGGAAGGDLFLAVLNSTSAVTARSAFDASSGEIHATLQAAQFQNASSARRTLLNRMRSADAAAQGWSLWGDVNGNWGSMDSDGNAARATNRGAAVTLGADTAVNNNWRVGFSGAYAANEVGVGLRRSSASLSTGQIAAYAYGKYDAIRLRSGFAYGFGTANSRRDIGFALFNDAVTAKQDVDSQQLFGEVGYGFDLTGVTIEPFAGLSWTRVNAGSFRESGGSAALAGNGSARDEGFSTLGAQLFTGGTSFAGGILTPSARVGWQHGFTNRLAARSLSFISSGQGFTVFGTPLDADRALIDLDATLALGGADISLGYTGSLGKRGEDHGVRMRVAVGL